MSLVRPEIFCIPKNKNQHTHTKIKPIIPMNHKENIYKIIILFGVLFYYLILLA